MNFAQPPIVRSKKFEADYNNYHRLSGEGKRDTDTFRNEMKNFITMYPEDFEKKPLENYLKSQLLMALH